MTFWLRFAAAAALLAGSVAPVAAQPAGPARADAAPVLRILERSDDGVIYEVTASWGRPLAEAADAGALYQVALAAVGGHVTASAAVALPSRVPPVVEVLAADYDEAPLGAAALAEADEQLAGPEAEVVSVGLERRQPTGTFVARLLRVDYERGTVRRYRRIVAAVRFAGARGGEAARSSENPHLAVGQSVLAAGTWFRIPVTREGIYRIDRAYISSLGLNPDQIDPDRVQVYGNGGMPVPALAGAPRIADLAENATFARGGGDGAFNEGDAVYFYGAAPHAWHWDSTAAAAGRPGWRHEINVFSAQNYYFLRVDGTGAQRVGSPAYPNRPGATVLTSITGRVFAEEDRPEGMIDRDGGGSGLDWLGRDVVPSRPSATVLDTLPPGLMAGEVAYRARVAALGGSSIALDFRSGGQTVHSVSLAALGGSLLARDVTTHFAQSVAAGARLRLDMTLRTTTAGPRAWIDYVEAFFPQALRADADYLRFHTPGGEAGLFEFVLSGFTSEPQVWDVTDPQAIRRLGVQASGSDFRVQVEATDPKRPRELVAFTLASARIRTPQAAQPVANQNLHAIGGHPEYVIVTAAAFRAAADELAEYRAADGLRTHVVEVEQIYNEFSGGMVDMRAVRDYLKFLYDRGPGEEPALRHVLLLGDTHYDFRGIKPGGEINNWVPTFQSDNSLHHINSYASDDYYGLLDDDEGVWLFQSSGSSSPERLDIGIGRLPVRSLQEARDVIGKIKRYEDPATYGDWRTRYTLVADDQYPNDWDEDLHLLNVNDVGKVVQQRVPAVNLQKIYAVSYPRVQTALGARYPEAHRDIIRSFNEGTLVWNYSGHGGPIALADERLLTLEDIRELTNFDRLPVIVTATCSFGRYDLVNDQSGGEVFLLNPNGGAVAVLTTTRVVYTSSAPTYNFGLNLRLNEYLLARDEAGRPLRIGEAFRLTKNTDIGAQGNNRKFGLLGDPAMRIGLPERHAAVTAVNGQAVSASPDPVLSTLELSEAPRAGAVAVATLADEGAQPRGGAQPVLRALEHATISGEVLDAAGQRDPTFNGEVEVTVFDAARMVPIPSSAPDPATFEAPCNHLRRENCQYETQTDRIYRGRASVREGAFTVEFVVPRDISYANEPGRISVYVASADGAQDGYGFTEGFLVGGTAGDPIQDDRGPRIALYLNDTTFVSGGLVGARPTLVARLFDENGINTVGAGVGHELLLTVDGAEQEALDIGRFYQGDLDSFKSGTVRYELPEQTPGPHTLALRAWDVANNSSTASLDYYVEDEAELVLRHVYNYPNPTTGPTRFFFEHNQPPGAIARIQLRIYTLSGRPVRTLDGVETLPDGVLPGGPVSIPWDGRDEDLDALATGVYLYKVRVEVERPDGQTQVSERVERLAVIR